MHVSDKVPTTRRRKLEEPPADETIKGRPNSSKDTPNNFNNKILNQEAVSIII